MRRTLKSEQESDESLIHSIREGDESAAATFFDRYVAKLEKLAGHNLSGDLSARFDTNDITQSVFRTFFRRVSRGEYSAPKADTIWNLLVVITLNKVRAAGNYHRAAKRDVARTADSDSDLTQLRQAIVSDEETLRVMHLTIQEVVGDLPETQQQMIQLRLEAHEVGEIADKVGRSKRTVERVLQSFRQRLQKVMGDDTV